MNFAAGFLRAELFGVSGESMVPRSALRECKFNANAESRITVYNKCFLSARRHRIREALARVPGCGRECHFDGAQSKPLPCKNNK
jgi:hypothetical protein